MVEWLDANVQWWHWVALGFFLAGIEMFVPSFFMIWIGVSAAVVGIVLLIGPVPFSVQLLLWGLLSLACLVTWFKFVAPRMKDRTKSGMGREALYGQVGTVLEQNPETSRGVLRFSAPVLGEDEWRFISEDKLTPGDKVVVRDISGNDLIVKLS